MDSAEKYIESIIEMANNSLCLMYLVPKKLISGRRGITNQLRTAGLFVSTPIKSESDSESASIYITKDKDYADRLIKKGISFGTKYPERKK